MDKSLILSNGLPFPLNGLVSYTTFDYTGTTFQSTFGSHGFTVTTTDTFRVNGKLGKSVYALKDAANYTINTNNSNLGLTNFPYSIGFWFKYGNDAGTTKIGDIFDFSTTTSVRGICCYHRRDTNKLTVYHGNGGNLAIGNIRTWDFDFTPVLDTWYYIVITSTAYNVCNVSVNTVSLGAGTAVGTATSGTFVGSNFSFFRRYSVLNECNSQYIDEFGVWNRVLTAKEVQTLYNGSKGKYLPIRPFNGLQSYWRMDEASGVVVNDSVGGKNGTASNARVVGGTGKINAGADFTQGNDYIQVTPTTIASNNTTISLWVKPASLHDGYVFTGRIGTAPNTYTIIWFANNATYKGFACTLNNSVNWCTSPAVAAINEWHHVVAVNDGSNTRLYVNAVLLDTEVCNAASVTITDIFIGAANTSVGFFNGETDEVGIWNRALSVEEVQALYNEGRGKYLPMQPYLGLQSYWRFDEASGLIAHDSVSGFNGTASNASIFDSVGKNGSGIKLDNQHYIDYGDIYKWTTSQPYSVSFWAKRNTGTVQFAVVLSNFDASLNCLFDLYFGTENFSFVIQQGGIANRAAILANNIAQYTDLAWNHYVFTYAGDRNANNIKVYKNGVEWTDKTVTNALTATGVLGGILQTGRRHTTTYATDFQLDELGLWNRALSANEVAELYNQGNGRFY